MVASVNHCSKKQPINHFNHLACKRVASGVTLASELILSIAISSSCCQTAASKNAHAKIRLKELFAHRATNPEEGAHNQRLRVETRVFTVGAFERFAWSCITAVTFSIERNVVAHHCINNLCMCATTSVASHRGGSTEYNVAKHRERCNVGALTHNFKAYFSLQWFTRDII